MQICRVCVVSFRNVRIVYFYKPVIGLLRRTVFYIFNTILYPKVKSIIVKARRHAWKVVNAGFYKKWYFTDTKDCILGESPDFPNGILFLLKTVFCCISSVLAPVYSGSTVSN